MAGFVRTKRVTDPLDARVRDRLVGRDHNSSSELGYASSGSEHSGSPCLSELVHGFLEEEDEPEIRIPEIDSDSDGVDSVSYRCVSAETIYSANATDCYRNLLLAHVSHATEIFSRLRSDKSSFRRSVMSYLRELGHNAAICKTRWESSSSGSLTAGSYEFIDSVSFSSQKRYFVDLDFAAEFEIARPSAQYSRLVQSLPRVFVGDGDDLKRIVRAMCDAMKRSMRSTELSLPPWRKNRYMQSKWFGPYRRTVNLILEGSFAPLSNVTTVKCRCVGFDDAVAALDVTVNGRAGLINKF